MTKAPFAISLLILSTFLAACGKDETKYEMSGIIHNKAVNPNLVATNNPNVRAKELIAADTGTKVPQKCRASQQFRSGTTDNADMRPVAVPALGIKHLGGFELEIMASTPEKARDILRVTEELLTWNIVCLPPTAAG